MRSSDIIKTKHAKHSLRCVPGSGTQGRDDPARGVRWSWWLLTPLYIGIVYAIIAFYMIIFSKPKTGEIVKLPDVSNSQMYRLYDNLYLEE